MSRNLTNVLHTHIILCTFCSIIFQKERNLLIFLPILCQRSIASAKASICEPSQFTPLLLPLVANDSLRLKLLLKVTMNGKPWWVGFVYGFSLLHFINYILKNGVFIYLFIQLLKNKLWFSRLTASWCRQTWSPKTSVIQVYN